MLKSDTDRLIELVRGRLLPECGLKALLNEPSVPDTVKLYIVEKHPEVTLLGSERALFSDEQTQERWAILEDFYQPDWESSVQGEEYHPDFRAVAPISLAVLADMFASLEQHRLRVAEVYMNPAEFADIRKQDPWSMYRSLPASNIHTLWGAPLFCHPCITPGYVYVCGEGYHENGWFRPGRIRRAEVFR